MRKMETLNNGNVKTEIYIRLRTRSGRKRIEVVDAPRSGVEPLMLHLARAFRWRGMLDKGEIASPEALAAELKVDRAYVSRTLRLTLLAPEIIHRIVSDEFPDGTEIMDFRKSLPALWNEQKAVLGFSIGSAEPEAAMPPSDKLRYFHQNCLSRKLP